MNFLIEGLLIGFGASIPIGPINILIMNQALKSYKSALLIGIGAMSADITYFLLLFFGFINFIDEKFLNYLALIGSLFLIFISLSIFRQKKINLTTNEVIDKTSLLKSYLKGYLLTLLNPYTIGFWLSVATYIAIKSTLIMLIGIVIAITLWSTLMPLAVSRSRHLLNERVIKIVNLLSVFIIIGFALAMLYNSF